VTPFTDCALPAAYETNGSVGRTGRRRVPVITNIRSLPCGAIRPGWCIGYPVPYAFERTAGCATRGGQGRAPCQGRWNRRTVTPASIAWLTLGALGLVAYPGGDAVAADSLGLYVGGALGQSLVEATVTRAFADIAPVSYTESIRERRAAFAVMLGARPRSLVGAEIDFIHFGEAAGSLFGNPADVSMQGAAAFGVLYLPVPVVDVYVKAGVARLESTVSGSICSPCACDFCRPSFQLNRTNTSGAGGVGIQYRLGSWAVRAEYERFNAAGGNPSLLSAGITWTFW
jgi:hypothetical protein